MRNATIPRPFGWALAALLCCAVTAQAQLLPTYRPGQKYRSLNTDVYDISIQKNGRLDVVLITGEPVFENVFPMVWYADEDEPEPMPIDGRWSGRTPVDDPLGEGQGMVIRRKETDWSLRAYPTKPFLAVQVAYNNRGKRPVTIKALMPWCLGDPKKGALRLGPGTDSAVLLANGPGFVPALGTGDAESETYIAAVNRANQRNLIAGFLTQDRAATRVAIGSPEDEDEGAFEIMRAACVYDPPIVLQPGEQLQSEVFYVALGETNPLTGLERYARAAAVINRARHDVPFIPSGWYLGDAWSVDGALASLSDIDAPLRNAGWRHVVVDVPNTTVWEQSETWDRLRALADALHAQDLTLGATLPLFRVPGSDELLNPLAEGAVDALTAAVRDFVGHTDLDAVYDTSGHDFASPMNTQPGLPMERAHLAFEAARAGMPRSVFFASTGTSLATVSSVDGQWLGPADPIQWEGNPFVGGVGIADVLAAEAQQFCVSPHWWRRVRVVPPQSAFPLGDSAWRTWVTGSTLLGDALLIDLSAGSVTDTDFLSRMTPPFRSALPLDLFDTERPALWVQGLDNHPGIVAALFNWSDSSSTAPAMPLLAAGLGATDLYSVYEPSIAAHHGTAQTALSADVAPQGVRLFHLLPHQNIPVVVDSSGRGSDVLPFVRDKNFVTAIPTALTVVLPEGKDTAFAAVLVPEGMNVTIPEGVDAEWTGDRLLTVRGVAGQTISLPLTGE